MIRLSTNCRYVVRILVYLAARKEARPASRREIADAEDITPAYIEQVLRPMKTTDLIKSFRGTKGGFMLGKAPEKISIADIVQATEGNISLVPCNAENCERASDCAVKPMWDSAGKALKRELARTTIADLAKRKKVSRKPRKSKFSSDT